VNVQQWRLSLCVVVVVVVFAGMWTCTVGVGVLELQHIDTFNFYDGSQGE